MHPAGFRGSHHQGVGRSRSRFDRGLRFTAAHAPGPPRAAKRQPDPSANRRIAASSPLSWAAPEKLPISPRPSARAAHGWWSVVATSQGQPCSQHHRLALDFVADQGMQGCLFCDIHSSVTSTEQLSRSSRSWRRLITPRSECSGERSTSRSPLASTSPTAAAAGQKTCIAIGAGRLRWLERKSKQPAAAIA